MSVERSERKPANEPDETNHADDNVFDARAAARGRAGRRVRARPARRFDARSGASSIDRAQRRAPPIRG
ncbi:hypothetical protein BURMUCF1_B0044 [Burkholderia multivorans ATCC BAA-247]|nr:hypothetical protein BURMUCF1_B0044 [Burkholderia multivorans ATCC BAA-247]